MNILSPIVSASISFWICVSFSFHFFLFSRAPKKYLQMLSTISLFPLAAIYNRKNTIFFEISLFPAHSFFCMCYLARKGVWIHFVLCLAHSYACMEWEVNLIGQNIIYHFCVMFFSSKKECSENFPPYWHENGRKSLPNAKDNNEDERKKFIHILIYEKKKSLECKCFRIRSQNEWTYTRSFQWKLIYSVKGENRRRSRRRHHPSFEVIIFILFLHFISHHARLCLRIHSLVNSLLHQRLFQFPFFSVLS